MLTPLNDVALIEIDKNPYKLGTLELVSSQPKETIGTGVLKQLPDKLLFLGFHSFAFESSLGNDSVMAKVYDHYKDLIGKRVYWKALSDRGMTLTKGEERYVMIKLTDLIGSSDVTEQYKTDDGKLGV